MSGCCYKNLLCFVPSISHVPQKTLLDEFGIDLNSGDDLTHDSFDLGTRYENQVKQNETTAHQSRIIVNGESSEMSVCSRFRERSLERELPGVLNLIFK